MEYCSICYKLFIHAHHFYYFMYPTKKVTFLLSGNISPL